MAQILYCIMAAAGQIYFREYFTQETNSYSFSPRQLSEMEPSSQTQARK
jgi:hypothetical protein